MSINRRRAGSRPLAVLLAPVAAVLFASVLLASCAGTPPPRTASRLPGAPERPPMTAAVAALQAKLAEGGRYVLDRQDLTVGGRRFPWDCTGTVCAIYWYAGIDLTRSFAMYPGNGVSRLYRTLEAAALLYDTEEPAAGDLVFWDDTYDANGDGLWNDPLTHVGMVMETAADGAVFYVHLHVRRGIMVERMNLREPSVHQRSERGQLVVVNAPMRLAEAGVPHPERWLAGQLYRILGMGYLLPLR